MEKSSPCGGCERGWLIVNRYLTSPAFTYIIDRLTEAAGRYGIDLIRRHNTDFTTPKSVDAAERPDFVIFWDKDIRLAQLLELRGLRLFNPAAAIEACDDKSLTYLRLLGSGIAMPKTVPLPKIFGEADWSESGFLESAARETGFPVIVKECFGSFGEQVYLARDISELYKIVAKIGTSPALLQECVSSSLGRDIRLYVVGNEVAAAMCRRSADGDFRANVTRGGSMLPHAPSPAETEMALAACRHLGLDFAGVDMLLGGGGAPLLCEVNSNAHFKNLDDFTGADIAGHIIRYIKLTLAGQAGTLA